jgi:uncharacterized iron-regulated membrane protein
MAKLFSLHRLYRLHAWAGLLGGLFLLVICVSGSVAVFRPEIERAADWGGASFDVRPGAGAPMSLEAAIGVARARHPGTDVIGAAYPAPPGSWHSHGATYALTLKERKGERQVLVHPWTGEVLADRLRPRGWADFVRQLHLRFYYGSFWGRWIVGGFGIVLLFATVSGLVIYRKFNKGRWWPTVRWGRGARIVTADLHKVVGLGSVAFNVMFGVTGAVLGLEGLARRYMAKEPPAARLARVESLPAGRVEEFVRRTRELIPGAEPTFVALQNRTSGRVRVSVEHGWRDLVKERESFVDFAAASGELVKVYDAREASGAARFYYAMEPLHFGRLGGAMWVKVVWAGMGLSGGFLSVSGYVIYFTRKSKRPKPVARAEKPGRETAAKEHADAEAELVPAR